MPKTWGIIALMRLDSPWWVLHLDFERGQGLNMIINPKILLAKLLLICTICFHSSLWAGNDKINYDCSTWNSTANATSAAQKASSFLSLFGILPDGVKRYTSIIKTMGVSEFYKALANICEKTQDYSVSYADAQFYEAMKYIVEISGGPLGKYFLTQLEISEVILDTYEKIQFNEGRKFDASFGACGSQLVFKIFTPRILRDKDLGSHESNKRVSSIVMTDDSGIKHMMYPIYQKIGNITGWECDSAANDVGQLTSYYEVHFKSGQRMIIPAENVFKISKLAREVKLNYQDETYKFRN